MPWNTVGSTFQLANRNIPPVRCFTAGYMVWKMEIRAVNVALQQEGRPGSGLLQLSRSDSSASSTSAIELRITEDLTGTISLSSDCLQNTRRYFLNSSSNLLRNFGNRILHCCGLKRKFGLSEHSSLTISASPDTDLCFFGVQGEINYDTDSFQFSTGGNNYRYHITGSVNIRFGLSAAGWQWIGSRVGTRAVSLVSRIPGAARVVLGILTGTTATIVVGTVACTALLTYSMAFLLDQARQNGEFWGNCIAYASGYVDALSGPELSRSQINNSIDAYRQQHRMRPARINGYIDALTDAMNTSYHRTRRNLLVRIGLGGELEAVRSDGSEILITLTGLGPFSYRSKNYIIGAFEYLLHYNRTRPITLQLPV